MQHVSDSFIEYLHTELADDPPVRWVRQDLTDEQTNALQMDYLNISVLGMSLDGSMEDVLVSLDLLSTNDRDAMNWLTTIRDVLLSQLYCIESDYTDPDLPVDTGRYVSWNRRNVQFTKVAEDSRGVHWNCTLPLCHSVF